MTTGADAASSASLLRPRVLPRNRGALAAAGVDVVRVAVVAVRSEVATQACGVVGASGERGVLFEEACGVWHGHAVAGATECLGLVAGLARLRVLDRQSPCVPPNSTGCGTGTLWHFSQKSRGWQVEHESICPMPWVFFQSLPWVTCHGPRVRALACLSPTWHVPHSVDTPFCSWQDVQSSMTGVPVHRVAFGWATVEWQVSQLEPAAHVECLIRSPPPRDPLITPSWQSMQALRDVCVTGPRYPSAVIAFGYMSSSSLALWLAKLHAPLER